MFVEVVVWMETHPDHLAQVRTLVNHCVRMQEERCYAKALAVFRGLEIPRRRRVSRRRSGKRPLPNGAKRRTQAVGGFEAKPRCLAKSTPDTCLASSVNSKHSVRTKRTDSLASDERQNAKNAYSNCCLLSSVWRFLAKPGLTLCSGVKWSRKVFQDPGLPLWLNASGHGGCLRTVQIEPDRQENLSAHRHRK